MTDRELFEQALAALCQSSDPKSGYRRNELFLSPKAHIELYQEAIEALRARLAEPPKDLELPLVRPEEFVKLIQGKENYWGIPVMRTEWPTPEPYPENFIDALRFDAAQSEPVAQFEFQNYGWWRDEEGKLQLGTQPQGE